MRFRSTPITAGAMLLALAITGCDQGATSSPTDIDRRAGSSAPYRQGATDVNMADQMFVMMMIPHHEQAIEMSDYILRKEGVDSEVAALAQQIKDAQEPEIEMMTDWLEDWGVAYGRSSMPGHMGHGDGMMSEGDMSALDEAEGVQAERLFLEQMIAHHEGAIEMAEQVIGAGESAEVRELAEAIIDGQSAEIVVMRELLALR